MSDTNNKTQSLTTTRTTTTTTTTHASTHTSTISGPGYCFQGSTKFYEDINTDEFTPSSFEIGLLEENVGTPWEDGVLPPWLRDRDEKEDELHNVSPMQKYVEWFNGIWHTGDPSSWSEEVFIDRAVLIDPSGISIGAKQATANFLLLFKYFPGLRGLVVSWAANDREIIINWRFQILRKGNKQPFLVPVIDKFCFLKGHVSFRLANFDIVTLLGYLSETYGADQLLDFLKASSKMAAKTGGIQRLPGIAMNLLSGLFYWPRPTSTGLKAQGSDGVVMLSWDEIPMSFEGSSKAMTLVRDEDQKPSYRICRSEGLDGNYERVGTTKVTALRDENLIKEMRDADLEPTSIFERIARKLRWPKTTTNWYTVSSVFESRPIPVEKDQPFTISESRKKRYKNWGYSIEGIDSSANKPRLKDLRQNTKR